ncbi:MAG: glycosyltransferase family 39 protein [Anaerolineales bacterium]
MKHTQIKLSGIMLLALVLRLIAIESRGLEYDDTFSFFLAGQPFGRIIAGTAADTMPPLYYFLLHLWINIGRQVWVLRLLNVLLSLGILVLIYQLTKRLFGEESGLWAAFFTAISPLQIFHAQGMRMYILLTLTLLGYLWFFTLLWLNREAEKSRCWGGLIICGALAMYSHNVAIFTLVAPTVFLALKRERRLLLISWTV